MVSRGAPPTPPTNNPVADMYGNDTYPWTAAVNWTNVVCALALWHSVAYVAVGFRSLPECSICRIVFECASKAVLSVNE